MSSHWQREKRALREAQRDRDDMARAVEHARKEALSMWERIEESDASADVKDILHRIATHVGMES